MADIIKYPTQDTYYIVWSDDRKDITGYGIVTSEQVLSSRSQVDTYLDKDAFITILSNNGITYED
jgi:hypothetical protein